MPENTFSIEIEPNQHMSGYLAQPKGNKGPGLILIPEIFGINNSMRNIADHFAKQGFLVFAPDIFWRLKPNVDLGYEGADLEEAYEYYHRFDVKTGVADLGAAAKSLRSHPSCTGKIATLGFCLGGKLSFLTAAHYPVDAAVAFYGGGIAEHLNEANNIKCPLLMHFGEDDEMIPEDQVDSIKAAFADRRNVEIFVYPGVGHAFYNHDRKSYNAAAAHLADERTLQFLGKFVF